MYHNKRKNNFIYFNKKKNKNKKLNLYIYSTLIFLFILLVCLNINSPKPPKIKNNNLIKDAENDNKSPPKIKEQWKYIQKLENL